MILTVEEIDDIAEVTCESTHAFAVALEAKLLEKLCAGVKVPEPVGQIYGVAGVQHCSTTANAPDGPLFSERQLRAYGAACRLKALEDAAEVCESEYNNWDNERPLRICAKAIRALKGEAP